MGPYKFLLHRHVVFFQVSQPHSHSCNLELQLSVFSPHRCIVVSWRYGSAPGPASGTLRKLALERSKEELVVASIHGIPETDLLKVQHLNCHLHRQPLVLRCVAAGFLR